ncbi:Elongation factor 1-delta [Saguinus oedipus]|uniref:Elongation factor 1-delta n=1 Tax=Saguinus oedipus TaxID=9490 RepID=A0ABQ9U252_SAGOE|nr:Elongation factor 1-delta [Saguinus oedipus]
MPQNMDGKGDHMRDGETERKALSAANQIDDNNDDDDDDDDDDFLRGPASADSSFLVAASLAGIRKMATSFLVHEKIWFDKLKYEDAERRFYEQMVGCVAGASVTLHDTARARENIQKLVARSSGPGASSGPSRAHSELVVRIVGLEVVNQSLVPRGAELARPPGHSPAHPATCLSRVRQVEPPARKAATVAEDDEDIDSPGSKDEEEDQEAAQLREKRLRQSTEKKAKKPRLVAKSSILLDIKPWDDETDVAQLEARAAMLLPVGYGIRKLQIQCVPEDRKVETHSLEEEIAKFEEHVQRVHTAASNMI